MMRVEVIGNATLYLGDCLEVMAGLPESPAAELGEWAREHEAIRLVREVVRRARAVSAGVDGWEPFE